MQQIITAKLKLLTTPEQHQWLRQTQLAYRDALNYASRYAFEHGKTSSNDRLQKGTYHEILALYGLPSQMACNVPRQVAGTYKGLWTKLMQNREHRRAGRTKKRYKGLDKPPKYISPTLTYNYGYDYTFKTEQRVSVLTLQGRIILSYQGYDRHVALIRRGATIGGAKLYYDKPHKQFYLLVSLELDLPDPTPESLPNMVGVDVGTRYLAVTATTSNGSSFYSGKRVRAKADHYARLQKRLQRKGTRSATRRKIAMSGRERRLKLQVNHTIAKSIVSAHPHTLIGLENLTGIRERTRRRRRRRKQNGTGTEPVSRKARRANRHASTWAFAELHTLIAYKAALSKSSLTIKVDADYTSQACLLCGYTDKRNRPGKGLLFICRNPQCLHRQRTGRPCTLRADLVGARNIACERFSSGRAGRERASCQYAPMRRTLRPKRHASHAMPSCGGARMRAPPLSKGKGQLTWTALESMTSPLNREACKRQSLASRLTRLSSRVIVVELLCVTNHTERTPMLLSVSVRTGGCCPSSPPYNC
jgi:putative transposase